MSRFCGKRAQKQAAFRRPAGSFLNGKQHAGLLLIVGKAGLGRLAIVGKGDADAQKQQCVGNSATAQIPCAGEHTDRRQRNAPPHQDLAQVVGVPGVFPKTRADKGAGAVFAEFVHLNYCVLA